MSRVAEFGVCILMLLAVLAVLAGLMEPIYMAVVDQAEVVTFGLTYDAAEAQRELIEQAQAQDLLYLCEEHAVERHGPLALTIKDTCEGNPAVKLQRALDGRWALGCMYEDRKWGISIYEEDGDYVTSFPNRAKSLEKLMKYLANRGYLQ